MNDSRLHMRTFLLFVGILFFSMPIAAQNEFLNKSNSIAPGIKNDRPATTNSIYTPNVFAPKKNDNSPSSNGIPD